MTDQKYLSVTLLSERQAAEHLGISIRTMQSWRIRGYGPSYIKCGKAVRYEPKELEAFKQQQTRQSTAEQPAT
jgi:hypothetical protein